MDAQLNFSLESVEKIIIFAYQTGYCDGIEDKYPQLKEYKNAEDYLQKKNEEFIRRFAKEETI